MSNQTAILALVGLGVVGFLVLRNGGQSVPPPAPADTGGGRTSRRDRFFGFLGDAGKTIIGTATEDLQIKVAAR